MSKKTTEETSANTDVNGTPLTPKKMCGVIMPIANTPGYEPGHWKDVLNILEDALKETEFEAKLVSERIDIGLIHEQIVTNIYENEIVICDVSSKNPNVMFELGMRLAFDKPTIIIKDELTNYSFDIGGILHLEYPSSLRHNRIEKFKSDLCKHVIATHKKSVSETDYSPFLKSFGRQIVPKSIDKLEVSENQYIIEKLNEINLKLKESAQNSFYSPYKYKRAEDTKSNKMISEDIISIIMSTLTQKEIRSIIEEENSLLLDLIKNQISNQYRYHISSEELIKLIKQLVY